ncbi:hypothetical protein BDW68DRAFT_76239 [Aspergillus falconensis]
MQTVHFVLQEARISVVILLLYTNNVVSSSGLAVFLHASANRQATVFSSFLCSWCAGNGFP